MMRQPLVLTEYQPSDPVTLSVAERDTLAQLVPGLTIQPTSGTTDSYRLTSGSDVGVVRVGDLTVELRPKVGVAPVIFMLSYALDPRIWRPQHAALTRNANLAEAIVPLFADAAQRALRPGLLHGYRVHDDAMNTVRGRVRFVDQFRTRTGLPLPVEVTYDDYTPDILENQLLRTAVDILGRLHLRHHSSRFSLARLHQQLNGISSLAPGGRMTPEPVWNRLNERYRPAVSLARLIITMASVEAQAGGEDASALLVDMNRVFEDFIRVALREALQLQDRDFPSGARVPRTYLDHQGAVPLLPDLSWWIGEHCIFVGDCKYKRPAGSIPNADIYQMLAYLTALNLSEGLLIYADLDRAPTKIVVQRTGKMIKMRALDVTVEPLAVLAQIRALADQIRRMASLRAVA